MDWMTQLSLTPCGLWTCTHFRYSNCVINGVSKRLTCGISLQGKFHVYTCAGSVKRDKSILYRCSPDGEEDG